MTILSDHDIEGWAVILWGAVAAQGWVKLADLHFLTFEDAGLPATSNDREVWRFCQERSMILLTGNRNMKDKDSLEKTLRDENTAVALPVVTISVPERLEEKAYRDACVERLMEIVLDLENVRGVGRLFIP